MIVSHPLPLAMIGLVAIAIVAVGSVLLLSLSSKSKVLHQHRDHYLHMLDASRQLRLPGNNGFINDPKTVELRLGQQSLLHAEEEYASSVLPYDGFLIDSQGEAGTTSSSVNNNVRTKLEMLPVIPDSLPWKEVPQAEREQTHTCPKDPNLWRCCIGQCQKKALEEGTQEFENLFLMPDMEGIISMGGLLEFLHSFVEQKRLERGVILPGDIETRKRIPEAEDAFSNQQQPPLYPADDAIYPWCTLWFIGDSQTRNQAMGAVCRLADFGYEISNCETTKEGKYAGLFQEKTCELTSNTSKHCPRMRVRMNYPMNFSKPENGYGTGTVDQWTEEDEAGVVLYSWGVHANSYAASFKWMREKFQPLYNDFQALPHHPQRYAFMWREHEPQHFASKGGVYPRGGNKLWANTCQDAEVYDDYRNEAIRDYFEKTSLIGKIPIIKNFDPLTPLYMFHIAHDCTHYCYSPWRFDLTWHGVALGLKHYLHPEEMRIEE